MLAQNHSVLFIYLHLFAKLDKEINDEPHIILAETRMFCPDLINFDKILALTLVRHRTSIFLAQAGLLLLFTSAYQALSEIFQVKIIDVAPLRSCPIIQTVEFCATLIRQMLVLTDKECVEVAVLIIKHLTILTEDFIS